MECRFARLDAATIKCEVCKSPIKSTADPSRVHRRCTGKPIKGLGDVIDRITTATGLKKLTERVRTALGIKKPCGCQKRRDRLNELWPL